VSLGGEGCVLCDALLGMRGEGLGIEADILAALKGERGVSLEGVVEEEGLLIPRAREAGGPTLTIRLPNSTPMVTSCWLLKRPSHRRTVSCRAEEG
jgi:hypothetical protein